MDNFVCSCFYRQIAQSASGRY